MAELSENENLVFFFDSFQSPTGTTLSSHSPSTRPSTLGQIVCGYLSLAIFTRIFARVNSCFHLICWLTFVHVFGCRAKFDDSIIVPNVEQLFMFPAYVSLAFIDMVFRFNLSFKYSLVSFAWECFNVFWL